jgi:hypothetical protein
MIFFLPIIIITKIIMILRTLFHTNPKKPKLLVWCPVWNRETNIAGLLRTCVIMGVDIIADCKEYETTISNTIKKKIFNNSQRTVGSNTIVFKPYNEIPEFSGKLSLLYYNLLSIISTLFAQFLLCR